MKKQSLITAFIIILILFSASLYFLMNQNKILKVTPPANQKVNFPLVDTGQKKCFNQDSEVICPKESEEFFGQDAEYTFLPFSYTNNEDGTVTDNNTGLIWQQSADLNEDGLINIDDKMYQEDAKSYCSELELADYSDWRLPNIKTLYSLINFKGIDYSEQSSGYNPFISTAFFDFAYGDESAGERAIVSQWASSTINVSKIVDNLEGMFGLNLADGRIKCYPTQKNFYVKCVRGNIDYGKNDFHDNKDKTITDHATQLMWQKSDSQKTMEWKQALDFCKKSNTAAYSDWRLPNAKELHSIVDYTRSPDTTDSAAIDSIFNSTSITNENNQKDWGFYWTSTTHKRNNGQGDYAVYISFGRALGYMNGTWLNVHGAGAQRSSPKVTLDISSLPNDPQNQYQVVDGTIAHGPQGDVLRSKNFVRCVRGSSSAYNGDSPAPSDDSTDWEYTGSSSNNTNEDQKSPPQEAIDV